MTLIMFSLGSAVVYGAADFFGGAAARRASARSVLLVSLPIGLLLLIVAALAIGNAFSPQGVAWGLAGGLAGGMLRGERPTPSMLIGVAICLVAICLVSLEEPRSGAARPGGGHARPRSARGPILAGVSGACFGVFFILLREAGRHGGMWALVASRAAGLMVVIAVGLAGWAMMRWSARPAPPRRVRPSLSRLVPADPAALWIAVMAGALDSVANVLYVFATRAGMLSLAAVLTSLYPAITVLLARVVYCERLRLVQRLGVVLALLGVALVTVG